jgi:hypothetical protein
MPDSGNPVITPGFPQAIETRSKSEFARFLPVMPVMEQGCPFQQVKW